MRNPWEEITLADYENHMKLDSVMQLQAMNEMMKGQFDAYPISNVAILGIAGGNGLEHIPAGKFEKVYGIDVNSAYLEEVVLRYPDLDGLLECMCIDLINETDQLPKADHHQMDERALTEAMLAIGYHVIKTLEHMLPNGKKLVQIDFER